MEKSEMMTANEVAKLKDVSRQAVGQAIRENRLPASRWGRFWIINRDDAEAWVVNEGKRRAARARQEESKDE